MGMLAITRRAVLAFFVMALGAAEVRAQGAWPPAGKAWGYNARLIPPGATSRTPLLDAAQATGATHLRIGISWRAYERSTTAQSPIPSDFSVPVGQVSSGHTADVDADYLAIVERGMTPVLIVHNAPGWASTFHACKEDPLAWLDTKRCPRDWESKADTLYPAADRLDVFQTFARAVAQRYPLAVIEGTNEPDWHAENRADYHPGPEAVADAQCALAAGVREVDPGRTVLTAGMYTLSYIQSYLQRLQGRGCYSHLSFHAYGQIRSGPQSYLRYIVDQVKQLVATYGNGQPFWITETGISSTAGYMANGELVTERRAARALPDWVTWLASVPEVGGLLVHSLRDNPYGEDGGSPTSFHYGFGGLDEQFQVKEPGAGVLPRFCWLVLSAGRDYPGCTGRTLPVPAPAAPTWFDAPVLSLAQAKPGAVAQVLFYEEGTPAPTLSIRWETCNSLGQGCVTVATGGMSYVIKTSDRLKHLRATVTLQNEHGTLASTTASSEIIY